MTEQIKPNKLQNLWRDGQEVDQQDLIDEQNFWQENFSALAQNHFGSGVLLASPEKKILFDSYNLSQEQAEILAADNFDGSPIFPENQPTDSLYGNQLEIVLSDSLAMGRLSVKVAILGIGLNDQIYCETFSFYHNDRQVTQKHYRKILAYFFNDFLGNKFCSRRLGGQILIREAQSYELSRHALVLEQSLEPNIFWRDFKLADQNKTLSEVLQEGLGPEYSVDALDLDITGPEPLRLPAGDVVLTYGQKFKTPINNIQKITLLLGASKNENEIPENQFNWDGSLVLSIHALQTSVTNPSTLVPDLAIDFDPDPVPLVQISFDQASLRNLGYVLNDVLQPVDFVFNTTKISSPGGLTVGKYYLFTLKRSGGVNNGDILVGIGNSRLSDSRLTTFNGLWVDSEEYDLWFKIWSDGTKISDGLAYDHGAILNLEKTSFDQKNGILVDYFYGYLPLKSTGQNTLNYCSVEAKKEKLILEQDQKNGNKVNSKQKNSPKIQYLLQSELDKQQESFEPLLLGCAKDSNPKKNPNLTKLQIYPGLAKNNQFIIISPDPDLLSLNLLGSKFYPTPSCCGDGFLIVKVDLCQDGYGDLNGDGVIDQEDLNLLSGLIGEGLALTSTQEKILAGQIETLSLLKGDLDGDGYVSAEDVNILTSYLNKTNNSFPVGSNFNHLVLTVQSGVGRYDSFYDCDGYVRLDGYVGLNVVDPANLNSAELLFSGYSPVQLGTEAEFQAVPFLPVEYRIENLPFWQEYLLQVKSEARILPANYSSNNSLEISECSEQLLSVCQEKYFEELICPAGKNDFYLPANLILGQGEILRPNGEHYKVDLEIGTLVLNIPVNQISQGSINLFEKFVADRGDGLTIGGFSAMKYADCSLVQPNDLALGKVKFGISISSFAVQADGYFSDGYDVLVQNYLGLSFDPVTAILSFSSQGMLSDLTDSTLISKIFVTVYLKKAGWNNLEKNISATELLGLLS